MERELIVTGVGGQGIQLLAKTLALAATREGRYAMLSADYGGEMRGGPSKASVVIGDSTPLRALPVLASAWSAIVAHHRFSEPALARLRPGGPVIANVPLVDPAGLRADVRVYPVDAAGVAAAAQAPQAIGFVLLGAYNAVTGLVLAESLAAAMAELLPPYRRQHAPANERALAAGAAALQERVA